jgi:glycogen operon protein
MRNKWFQQRSIKGKGVTDIEWFLPEGITMSDEHWDQTLAKSLGIFLSGDHLSIRDEQGEEIIDDTFYIMFNSDSTSVLFTLPGEEWSKSWLRILDTYDGFFDPRCGKYPLKASSTIEVKGRSIVLLIRKKKQKVRARIT